MHLDSVHGNVHFFGGANYGSHEGGNICFDLLISQYDILLSSFATTPFILGASCPNTCLAIEQMKNVRQLVTVLTKAPTISSLVLLLVFPLAMSIHLPLSHWVSPSLCPGSCLACLHPLNQWHIWGGVHKHVIFLDDLQRRFGSLPLHNQEEQPPLWCCPSCGYFCSRS